MTDGSRLGHSGGSDWKAQQLAKLAAEGAKRDVSPLGVQPRVGVGYYAMTPGGIQVWVPLHGWDGRF